MKSMFLAAALISTAVWAEPVYVITAKCVGDRIRLDDQYEVLYPKKLCKLPLVNKSDMRHFERNIGGHKFMGCWGILLGEQISLIDSSGSQNVQLITTYTLAEADKDGTAVVTRSPYTGTMYEQAEHLCR